MTHHGTSRVSSLVRVAAGGVLALAGALLVTACGGGSEGVVAPDVSATQTAREQAALNRAISMNAEALGRTVKGERAARASSQ